MAIGDYVETDRGKIAYVCLIDGEQITLSDGRTYHRSTLRSVSDRAELARMQADDKRRADQVREFEEGSAKQKSGAESPAEC